VAEQLYLILVEVPQAARSVRPEARKLQLLFLRQFSQGLDLVCGDQPAAILNSLVDSFDAGGLLVYPQAFCVELLACCFAQLCEDRFPLLLDHLGDLFVEERRIKSRLWPEPTERFTDYEFIRLVQFHSVIRSFRFEVGGFALT